MLHANVSWIPLTTIMRTLVLKISTTVSYIHSDFCKVLIKGFCLQSTLIKVHSQSLYVLQIYAPHLLVMFLMVFKVFQDGANYRGQMKAKARKILLKHFTDLQAPTTQDPDFDWDACHRRIGACAKALLVDGYFLRGGFDINVFAYSSCSNLIPH